jgi:DNA (cytosine-5)-methyltransferase 1
VTTLPTSLPVEFRPPELRLYGDEIAIDGFAGGGGASTGFEMAMGRSPDVAINHDPIALAMHRRNHPTTRHYPEDICLLNPHRVVQGRRVGCAWFSPDCTYHSKARGGKPFRDRNKARRLRGLAGIIVRWAVEVRPRVLVVENVEEFEGWCVLDADGRPDPDKWGQSFDRWVARLRNLGYALEWRELRASPYGAPTSRKRLFIIARCDGQPIVWPKATHGPTGNPYRTAAECIDFSLPIPSIFLTPAEARVWGKVHGVAPPKRPLAMPTLRRVARGVWRYVIDTGDPFIISVRHQDESHIHSIHEPLHTIPASDREFALIAPSLVRIAHGEHDASGKKRGKGEHALTEPLPTQTGSNEFALVAATLANTRNGERLGQAPRVSDIRQPFGTITALGSQGALVAAFLAKHNGGHEATGQRLLDPTHAITTRDQKVLVTSHLVKLYGTCQDGGPVSEPMPTVTAYGNHIAEVRAFLVKFYGTKKDGRPLHLPLDTITTKERFGLVTVTIAGEQYVIADIGMRMLTPRELFRAQGFPESYQIDEIDVLDDEQLFASTRKLTKKEQTRLVGNSVCPQVAAAIIRANYTSALEAVA